MIFSGGLLRMRRMIRNIALQIMMLLLISSCNPGISKDGKVTSNWQNEVTISHDISIPYSVQNVNDYWLTISNQTTNSLRLTDVSLIETTLDGIDINQVIDSSECKTLAPEANCELKISLPKDLTISGTALIYFSLNYISDKTGKSYLVKKPLTLYANPLVESGVDFEFQQNSLTQNIVDTEKSYDIAIPFRLTQDYQSLTLTAGESTVLSKKIICADPNYKQGTSCSALVKFDRKETNPQIHIYGLNSQGVTNNFAVDLNIIANAVAHLVYLNAPVLLNFDKTKQSVTVLNDGADVARDITYSFDGGNQGVTKSSTCGATTLNAGDTCSLTYELNTTKYLSGHNQQQIAYTNGIAGATKITDSYFVYSVSHPTIKITTTPAINSDSGIVITPAQYFTITAATAAVPMKNDTVQVSNLSELRAKGIMIAPPTSCSTSVNGNNSCSFYVIASNIALVSNDDSYTINLSSGQNDNYIIDPPNVSFKVVGAESITSTIRLPQTGQITSDKDFDDASYLMGVAWAKERDGKPTNPISRFESVTNAAGECIIDRLTGLMWLKNANYLGEHVNFNDAVDRIKNRTVDFCGYGGWHLPTIHELRSLVNNANNSVTWLESQGFKNTHVDYYWSSTNRLVNNSINSAWVVNFNTGRVTDSSKNDGRDVWPVRRIPESRFSIEGDCITDNETGLTWLRNANKFGNLDWNTAESAAEKLVACGYDDWYLPTVKELKTLKSVDGSTGDTLANKLISKGFLNVQHSSYWSSTLNDEINRKWPSLIYFKNDAMFEDVQSLSTFSFVWPVRRNKLTRFSVDGDCITDNETGLMWLRNANKFGDLDWNTAESAAEKLVACGYDDWYLPTIKEFKTLKSVDSSAGDTLANKLISKGFLNVQHFTYWSSTDDPTIKTRKWSVNINRSVEANSIGRDRLFVWPVRHVRQNLTRYYSVDGDCIIDDRRGLMWLKNANLFNLQTWDNAKKLAYNIDACGYNRSWRLPTHTEFKALLFLLGSPENKKEWLSYLGFVGIPDDTYYWTSSLNPGILRDVMAVYINNGLLTNHPKEKLFAFLPVAEVNYKYQ